jgi:hypothetical protein
MGIPFILARQKSDLVKHENEFDILPGQVKSE